MLRKTKGIVISYIKYRETSIIVRIFTRDLGLKTYLVNGVRREKSKLKMAFYQPLSLLELVVYDREGASMNRISETKLAYAFQRIPFDFYRSGVAMFMGEVIGKAIYDNYQNEKLFDFVQDSVIYLDEEHANLSVYPLAFLLRLSTFLGFAPASAGEFFEQMQQGIGHFAVDEEEKYHLDQLLLSPFDSPLRIPKGIRKRLLDDLLLFYKLHLDTFSEVKSHKVLSQIMHGG